MDRKQLKSLMFNYVTQNIPEGVDSNDAIELMKGYLDKTLPTPEGPAENDVSFTIVHQLPEQLWCLYDRRCDVYYNLETANKPAIKGLVVMSRRILIDPFADAINDDPESHFIPTAVAFEEICEITREQGLDALFHIEDLHKILVYYVT